MKSAAKKKSPTKLSRNRELPFVFINMAMTADGKTASANRAISTFGSKRDHDHLYELRATADAVMCGARTIDLNPVLLGSGGKHYERLRVKTGLAQFSLRVIVSGSGSINPDAEIFKHRFSPLLIITTERAGPRKLKLLKSLADEVFVGGKTEIDFPSVLAWLNSKWKVNRLLCEGGGELNDALFRANLVNELHLTLCPKILGGRTAATIADGPGVKHLTEATALTLQSAQRHGDELFLRFAVWLKHGSKRLVPNISASAKMKKWPPLPQTTLKTARVSTCGRSSCHQTQGT